MYIEHANTSIDVNTTLQFIPQNTLLILSRAYKLYIFTCTKTNKHVYTHKNITKTNQNDAKLSPLLRPYIYTINASIFGLTFIPWWLKIGKIESFNLSWLVLLVILWYYFSNTWHFQDMISIRLMMSSSTWIKYSI